MAQASDANDTHAVRGLDVEGVKGVEDSGAAAHERSGVRARDRLRDAEDVIFLPDGVGCEGSLVEVGIAVDSLISAEGLVPGEALLAAVAAVVDISPANGVAFLDFLHCRSDILDPYQLVVLDMGLENNLPPRFLRPRGREPCQVSSCGYRCHKPQSG